VNEPVFDPWAALRRHTPARIALGRSGDALPTAEVLRFAAAHAMARDAVHVPLDGAALAAALAADGWPTIEVQSQAATRAIYLRRPDLGRRLSPAGVARLVPAEGPPDVAVIAADGLSATAVQRHLPALLAALRRVLADSLSMSPVVIATQARVALGDEVGERLGARLALILIGERPGLSSPDSVGAYLTYSPRVGSTDALRNCVSNIRPEGLAIDAAARRIAWLMRAALARGMTGVGLKDDSGGAALGQAQGAGEPLPP
jgi:ethanolamine ammonia-lyase small subunit